jgi:hypothetical protein
LVGGSEGKKTHGRPRQKWENNIKVDLKEKCVRMWLESSGLGYGIAADSPPCSKKPPCSIKQGIP